MNESLEDNQYKEIFDPRDDEDVDFNQSIDDDEPDSQSTFDKYTKQQVAVLSAMIGMIIGTVITELKHFI